MIKIDIQQLSEAWFYARLGRVTGTRFKDLVAAKTTASYNNLVAEVASEIITESNADEPSYENEWMVRGHELEPVARIEYSELMEEAVEQCGFIMPDEDHKFHEWLGISPDGLTAKGMIEIKCPKRSTHIYYIRENRLPTEYFWQVQGQLYVTGLPYCDFVSYYPKMKLFIIRVLPDPAAFTRIEMEMEFFIKNVCELVSIYGKYESI